MVSFLISYGILGIIIAALIEPIFMPLPMEVVFIPIVITNTKRAFLYSLILVAFSAFGSVIGYIVGKNIGRNILKKLVSEGNLGKIENKYNKNAFLAILTSAFTPIPYEAYVLSAGIFKVNFTKFITSAVLSRAIRYIPQGIIISLYGVTLINVIKNYTIIMGIAVLMAILLFKYAFRRK